MMRMLTQRYEIYLLGREKIMGLTLANQLEAERLLKQAIRIDPTFARARCPRLELRLASNA
jgi:hypothetical protein